MKKVKKVKKVPSVPVVAEKRENWPVVAPKKPGYKERKQRKKGRKPRKILKKLADLGITRTPPQQVSKKRVKKAKPYSKERKKRKVSEAKKPKYKRKMGRGTGRRDGTLGNRIGVYSSNVASIGYGVDEEILEVEFHSGAVYQYHDVPEDVWESFQTAPSKGRFVWTELRSYGADDTYVYERIE